jgi:hypothetical protein
MEHTGYEKKRRRRPGAWTVCAGLAILAMDRLAAGAFGLPAGVLRAGPNGIVLTVLGAGWWRCDGVALGAEP